MPRNKIFTVIMDTDVSPIFEESEALAAPPSTPPPLPVDQTDPAPPSCSWLDDVMEQQHPPLQQEYSMYNQAPPPWHYGQVPQVPPPQDPKWDPFSTIGATAWVALGVAFIIGFIVGKLR